MEFADFGDEEGETGGIVGVSKKVEIRFWEEMIIGGVVRGGGDEEDGFARSCGGGDCRDGDEDGEEEESGGGHCDGGDCGVPMEVGEKIEGIDEWIRRCTVRPG